MKKTVRVIFGTIILVGSILGYSPAMAFTQDTGTITQMYVAPDGSIAIRLSNNFANAVSGSQCTTSNGWAGSDTMSNVLKAALMAVKTSDLTVTVTIDGCAAGGGWFRLIDIYW